MIAECRDLKKLLVNLVAVGNFQQVREEDQGTMWALGNGGFRKYKSQPDVVYTCALKVLNCIKGLPHTPSFFVIFVGLGPKWAHVVDESTSCFPSLGYSRPKHVDAHDKSDSVIVIQQIKDCDTKATFYLGKQQLTIPLWPKALCMHFDASTIPHWTKPGDANTWVGIAVVKK